MTIVHPTGVVTGHVYCMDTNGPARQARVTLQSAAEIADFDAQAQRETRVRGAVRASNSVETRLDGSFTIEGLSPGIYYVMAELAGYISPVAQFNEYELQEPTSAVKEKLKKIVQRVTVEANQRVSVEVLLERGAAINGRVIYDDGIPATNSTIQILRKDENSNWVPFRPTLVGLWGGTRTDDKGDYRIAGLPGGQYLVEADLGETRTSVSLLVAGGASMEDAVPILSPLAIYSGDATRTKDAKPLVIGRGEDRVGADIVIPLSKLHTVGGSVVAEADGHSLNFGRVQLLNASDKAMLSYTQIEQGGSFELDFVPEGDYLLETYFAADAIPREGVPAISEGDSFVILKPMHIYGEGKQLLSVHGDMSNVLVKVPEKEKRLIGNAPSESTPR